LRESSNGQHVAAPASTLSQPHRPLRGLSLSGAFSLGEASDDLGRYQFQVVAANVADAVRSIGGLIFDRAMAGWQVSVVVDGDADDRPLRILGARVAKRLSDLNHARVLPRPHLLAVATDVMVKSDAVRRHVLEIGDDNQTEVLLWGRHHPTNLSRTFVAVRHHPSAAAHLFKSHALAAGGLQAMQRADEGFYSPA
jgi:hypothetical protein